MPVSILGSHGRVLEILGAGRAQENIPEGWCAKWHMLCPVDLIPKYMERFLKRRVLEGEPVPPGEYKILFKVLFIKRILSVHLYTYYYS